jgi:hypothetical protein
MPACAGMASGITPGAAQHAFPGVRPFEPSVILCFAGVWRLLSIWEPASGRRPEWRRVTVAPQGPLPHFQIRASLKHAGFDRSPSQDRSDLRSAPARAKRRRCRKSSELREACALTRLPAQGHSGESCGLSTRESLSRLFPPRRSAENRARCSDTLVARGPGRAGAEPWHANRGRARGSPQL